MNKYVVAELKDEESAKKACQLLGLVGITDLVIEQSSDNVIYEVGKQPVRDGRVHTYLLSDESNNLDARTILGYVDEQKDWATGEITRKAIWDALPSYFEPTS